MNPDGKYVLVTYLLEYDKFRELDKHVPEGTLGLADRVSMEDMADEHRARGQGQAMAIGMNRAAKDQLGIPWRKT